MTEDTDETSRTRILFFSRGRGRGHALRDLMIAEHLSHQASVDVQFVSYGTGASALRAAGRVIYDLKFPDDNPFIETIVSATRLAYEQRPDLIIAHEEFAALIAARSANIPALFVTDWFLDPSHMFMKSLELANEILFLEDKGLFTEPPALCGKVHYFGPILRRM